MARVIPADLDLDSLRPEAERNVIRQLLKGLDDDWYIVPKAPVLIERQTAEIDVVLVSPHSGSIADLRSCAGFKDQPTRS